MTIKLIEAPTVSLVASNVPDTYAMNLHLHSLGLQQSTETRPSDGQYVIEYAARGCYRSYGKGRPHDEHIKHLVDTGHWSCLEHAVFTFAIAGIGRTCSEQMNRHRHLSPSQESQRYVDASDIAFVVPPALLPYRRSVHPTRRKAFEAWTQTIYAAHAAYSDVVAWLLDDGFDRKQAREAARSVLPGCAETRMVLTGNARAWIEACRKRCSSHADAEIRRLMCVVWGIVARELHDVASRFCRCPLADGTFELLQLAEPHNA